MQNSIAAGTVFQNRYTVISQLGKGGYGAVYKAWDSKFGRHVALKANELQDRATVAQFFFEAQVLAKISHTNIVRVSDHFATPAGQQCLVMSFIEGETLEERVQKLGNDVRNIDVAGAVEIATKICSALTHIHTAVAPITHRDIKPSNICIEAHTQEPILVDFGLAKPLVLGGISVTGAQGITVGYSPPEQYYSGLGKTDQRSDIYALGATLYYALTLQEVPPSIDLLIDKSKVPAPKTINANVPQAISDAVMKAINLESKDRFQSAADFRQALTKRQASVSNTPQQVASLPPRKSSHSVNQVASSITLARRYGAVLALFISCLIGVFFVRPRVVEQRGNLTKTAVQQIVHEEATVSAQQTREAADRVAQIATVTATALTIVPRLTYTSVRSSTMTPSFTPVPISNNCEATIRGMTGGQRFVFQYPDGGEMGQTRKITNNSVVNVIATIPGAAWYQIIDSDGEQGWIRNEFLAFVDLACQSTIWMPTLAPTPTIWIPTPTPTILTSNSNCTATNIGGQKLVYQYPGGVETVQTRTLTNKAAVNVVATIADKAWYRIVDPDGNEGWVRNDFLSFTDLACQPTVMEVSYALGMHSEDVNAPTTVIADETFISNTYQWNINGLILPLDRADYGEQFVVIDAYGGEAVMVSHATELIQSGPMQFIMAFDRFNASGSSEVGLRLRSTGDDYIRVAINAECTLFVYQTNELVYQRDFEAGANDCSSDNIPDVLKISLDEDMVMTVQINDSDDMPVLLTDPSGKYSQGTISVDAKDARVSLFYLAAVQP